MTTPATAHSWTLLFEPLGALVFRDDRPFDAGSHSLATSRFPLPSVFRGAIRTALFELTRANFHKPPDFDLEGINKELLGGSEHSEKFDLLGPLVARRIDSGTRSSAAYQYLLPWPGDLAITKRYPETKLHTVVLEPRGQRKRQSMSLRLGPPRDDDEHHRELGPIDAQRLPWASETLGKPPKLDPWLTHDGAEEYVKRSDGTNPGAVLKTGDHWFDASKILKKEVRVGIARATKSLVAAESMLYTLIAWRMCPRHRFAVEVRSNRLDKNERKQLGQLLADLDGRLVRLGGKSGHAKVEVLEGSIATPWAVAPSNRPTSAGKLWLWTPALFDPDRSPGSAVALGQSLRVGGFDMVACRPRPLLGAFDRGTVLWFSAPDQASHAHHLPSTSHGHGYWIPRSNP